MLSKSKQTITTIADKQGIPVQNGNPKCESSYMDRVVFAMTSAICFINACACYHELKSNIINIKVSTFGNQVCAKLVREITTTNTF